MNKESLKILGKAFDAEISAALNGGIPIMQTKSKFAEKLVDDGYLSVETQVIGAGTRFPVTVSGYILTELGRMTFCMSC